MSYSSRPQLDSGALVAALLLARLNLQNRATCYLFKQRFRIDRGLDNYQGLQNGDIKVLAGTSIGSMKGNSNDKQPMQIVQMDQAR